MEEIVDGLSPYTVQDCIREAIELLYGDYAVVIGQALSVKYYSPYTKSCIVRTSRDYYKYVWAAITLITSLKNRRCAMHVIHTSGTIKLLQEFAIKHDTKKLKLLKETNVISDKKAASLEKQYINEIQKLQ